MLQENLRIVRDTVGRACELSRRSEDDVTLIAVTKSVGADQARKVVELGVTNLAENRVDKLLEKKQALSDFSNITWHLIGNLQRRKVKLIINEVDYFHALDSLRLAEEIEKRADHMIRCFVEVNVSGEESKHGIAPDELSTFIANLSDLKKVEIVGLMTMAPFDASDEELHAVFHRLKELQELIQSKNFPHAPCTELSMGMSNDYPAAIEEGATFIRVGTAIFKDA